jgi:hypothetical protein
VGRKKTRTANTSSLREELGFHYSYLHYVCGWKKTRAPRGKGMRRERIKERLKKEKNKEFNSVKIFICMKKGEEKINNKKQKN